MLSKIKEKFSQQPLKFDDLESIIPHDQSVDYDDTDDVTSDDLFSNRKKKNSFSLSPSTNLFTSGNNTARGMGVKKNSFNKLFLNSPSHDENTHPNAEASKGLEKKSSLNKMANDSFKMKGLSEALPHPVTPSQDDRFATSRPVRDSPTSSSATAAAAKVPSIFRDTMFSPDKPAPAVVTRHTQIWSQSKQEPDEEKHADISYGYDNYNSENYDSYYEQADNNYAEYQYTEEPSYSVDVDALFSKVRHNHGEYVAQQLSSGLNPNLVDYNGNTMLHICAQNNNKKIASLLLNSEGIECDINILNNKSHTPLDYAEKYGHTKLAQYLIGKGAVSGLQQEVRGPSMASSSYNSSNTNVRYR